MKTMLCYRKYFLRMMVVMAVLLVSRWGYAQPCGTETLQGTLSTPTSSWQTTGLQENTVANSYHYYNVSLVQGNVYVFSLCSSDGSGSNTGYANYDAYLRLRDPNGTSVATDDDGCGHLQDCDRHA